jgi:hypothetical protein
VAGVDGIGLALALSHAARRPHMGRFILGLVVGIILIIWLFVSCVSALF